MTETRETNWLPLVAVAGVAALGYAWFKFGKPLPTADAAKALANKVAPPTPPLIMPKKPAASGSVKVRRNVNKS